MQWLPVTSGTELPRYSTVLGIPHSLAIVIGRLLSKLSSFLGYPIGISLPPDIIKYASDAQSQKALRILHKLHKTGIVKSFSTTYDSTFADEPNNYLTIAELSISDRFGFSGRGADLLDRTRTYWPALGEAIERHSMDDPYVLKLPSVKATMIELQKQGKKHINLKHIAGIDPQHRLQPNNRYELSYDESTKFTWTEAVDLRTKQKVLAPLQWFSFRYIRESVQKRSEISSHPVEPLLSPAITTGAAAGSDINDAVLRGTLEVIERDAFMIYWLNQIPARQLDITTFKDARMKKLVILAEEYCLEPHLLYLETDFPVHTVCVVLLDKTGVGPAVLVGAKSGFDLTDVAYGALGETLALRSGNRRIMSRYAQRESSIDDIYEMNHIERMIFWYKKENIKFIEQFISGQLVSVDEIIKLDQLNPSTTKIEQINKVLEQNNYEAVYKEIVRPDIKETAEGISVVMVKIPMLQPLYLEECVASSYGERLEKIPRMFGYEPRRSVYLECPHPFP